MVTSNTVFDSRKLKKLLKQPNGCVFLQTSERHIALSPNALNDIKEAICAHLNKLVTQFDHELDAVVLGYRHIKILTDVGTILGDSPHIHIDIKADFYLFKPQKGDILLGIINKISRDNIGCLVHDYFNASIPLDFENKKFDINNASKGDPLTFQVEVVDFSESLPYIEGKLLDISLKEENNLDMSGIERKKKITKVKSKVGEHEEAFNTNLDPKSLTSILKKSSSNLVLSSPARRISFHGDACEKSGDAEHSERYPSENKKHKKKKRDKCENLEVYQKEAMETKHSRSKWNILENEGNFLDSEETDTLLTEEPKREKSKKKSKSCGSGGELLETEEHLQDHTELFSGKPKNRKHGESSYESLGQGAHMEMEDLNKSGMKGNKKGKVKTFGEQKNMEIPLKEDNFLNNSYSNRESKSMNDLSSLEKKLKRKRKDLDPADEEGSEENVMATNIKKVLKDKKKKKNDQSGEGSNKSLNNPDLSLTRILKSVKEKKQIKPDASVIPASIEKNISEPKRKKTKNEARNQSKIKSNDVFEMVSTYTHPNIRNIKQEHEENQPDTIVHNPSVSDAKRNKKRKRKGEQGSDFDESKKAPKSLLPKPPSKKKGKYKNISEADLACLSPIKPSDDQPTGDVSNFNFMTSTQIEKVPKKVRIPSTKQTIDHPVEAIKGIPRNNSDSDDSIYDDTDPLSSTQLGTVPQRKKLFGVSPIKSPPNINMSDSSNACSSDDAPSDSNQSQKKNIDPFSSTQVKTVLQAKKSFGKSPILPSENMSDSSMHSSDNASNFKTLLPPSRNSNVALNKLKETKQNVKDFDNKIRMSKTGKTSSTDKIKLNSLVESKHHQQSEESSNSDSSSSTNCSARLSGMKFDTMQQKTVGRTSKFQKGSCEKLKQGGADSSSSASDTPSTRGQLITNAGTPEIDESSSDSYTPTNDKKNIQKLGNKVDDSPDEDGYDSDLPDHLQKCLKQSPISKNENKILGKIQTTLPNTSISGKIKNSPSKNTHTDTSKIENHEESNDILSDLPLPALTTQTLNAKVTQKGVRQSTVGNHRRKVSPQKHETKKSGNRLSVSDKSSDDMFSELPLPKLPIQETKNAVKKQEMKSDKLDSDSKHSTGKKSNDQTSKRNLKNVGSDKDAILKELLQRTKLEIYSKGKSENPASKVVEGPKNERKKKSKK